MFCLFVSLLAVLLKLSSQVDHMKKSEMIGDQSQIALIICSLFLSLVAKQSASWE